MPRKWRLNLCKRAKALGWVRLFNEGSVIPSRSHHKNTSLDLDTGRKITFGTDLYFVYRQHVISLR